MFQPLEGIRILDCTLGYEDLRGLKPNIIYCSATGYGQDGPYAEKAGHDINYLAISGILSQTGAHTGRPVIPGIPLEDPHLMDRGMIREMCDPERGTALQIGFPARFSETLCDKRSPAPRFGEHTMEILSNLGYGPSDISRFAEDGVI